MPFLKFTEKALLLVMRALGGLVGLLVLMIIEFIQFVFIFAFTNGKSPKSESPMPVVSVSPVVSSAIVGQTAAFTAPLTIQMDDDASVAMAHLQIHDGVVADSNTKVIQLSLYGGKSPRIERTLRIPAEKYDFQRINWRFERFALPAFTPEIAEQSGLPFNFEGAKTYSLPEFDSKVIAKRMASKVRAFSELPELLKQSQPKTSLAPDSHDAPTSEQSAAMSEATGKVVSASTVMVRPEGKAPYKSFAVVVNTTNGQVSFQGVDLEHQFKKYAFSINDLITIKKSSSKFDFTDSNGKTKARTKNTFEITVLQKAVA